MSLSGNIVLVGSALALPYVIDKVFGKRLIPERKDFSESLEDRIISSRDVISISNFTLPSIFYSSSYKAYGVSGEMHHFFYSDPSVVDSIERGILEHNLRLEFTFGPDIYVKNKEFFRLIAWYPENFILKRRSSRIDMHFKEFFLENGKQIIQIDYPHSQNPKDDERKGILFYFNHPNFIKTKQIVDKKFIEFSKQSKLIQIKSDNYSSRVDNLINEFTCKDFLGGFISDVSRTKNVKRSFLKEIEELKSYLLEYEPL